jgi:hypothetical protein
MPVPRELREVDALIERAKRLPTDHQLRTTVLFDLGQLRDAWSWMQSTTVSVPTCAWGLLGLSLAHLHARLITCEERAGELRRVPA